MTQQLSNEIDSTDNRITHSVIMVDAALASRWLERNSNNRRVRRLIAARYARDMVEGRWTFTGDPIRFAADGTLLDGQHRLFAVIMAATVTLPVLVIRGLPPETQGAMDQGSKRTASDQLTLRGYKHTVLLGSSVRQYLAWTEGYLFRDNKLVTAEITTPWIEQWVAEHPDEVEFITSVIPPGQLTKTDAPPSAAGAAALAFYRIDPEATLEFFQLLATGAGTEGHPIVTLDKRLSRQRREHLKMPTRDYLAMFVQAWNAWRENRVMFKFQRPHGGELVAREFPGPPVTPGEVFWFVMGGVTGALCLMQVEVFTAHRARRRAMHPMQYAMKHLPPPPPDPWEGVNIPVPRRTTPAANECVECRRFFKPRGGLAVHRYRVHSATVHRPDEVTAP